MAKAKSQRILRWHWHYFPDRYEREKLLQVYQLLVPLTPLSPIPWPPPSRKKTLR